MKYFATILALLLFTTSALAYDIKPTTYEFSDVSPYHEYVFHTLNAIDMFQTISAAKKPGCYQEANPLTRRLIGKNPSSDSIVISSIAYSVLYHYGSDMIDKSSLPKWTKNVTFSLGIAAKLNTVVNNHRIGAYVDGARPERIGCYH